MKRIIFLLVGIFIFAYGCNDGLLNTDFALENGNLKKAEIKMVPIKGEVFITVDEYDAQGLGAKGKMSGYFSHLGKLNETKSTWENMIHDFSEYPPKIKFIQDIVLCAANGDLVYATYTGTINLTTAEINGFTDFEDGTGRFENASGQMTSSGKAEFDGTGRVVGIYLTGEGEISSVGSSK